MRQSYSASHFAALFPCAAGGSGLDSKEKKVFWSGRDVQLSKTPQNSPIFSSNGTSVLWEKACSQFFYDLRFSRPRLGLKRVLFRTEWPLTFALLLYPRSVQMDRSALGIRRSICYNYVLLTELLILVPTELQQNYTRNQILTLRLSRANLSL